MRSSTLPPSPPQLPVGASSSPVVEAAVGLPENLDAIVRVKDISTALHRAHDLVGDKDPIPDSFDPAAFATLVLGSALSEVIDLGQPVSGAIVGDMKKPDFVVAIAVPSIEVAARHLGQEFQWSGGDPKIVKLEAGEFPCQIRPAKGGAPYRLVCGSNAKALDAAAAYLADIVAVDPLRADVEIELDLVRFVPDTAPDGPSDAFARRLVSSLLGGLQPFDVGATFGDEGLDVSFGGKVAGGATAPFGALMWKGSRSSSPIPATFWRLPRAAEAAFYSHGVAREELGPVRSFVREFIHQQVVADTAPPGVEQRFVTAFESLFMTGGAVVLAHGQSRATPRDEGADAEAGGAVVAPHSWTVVGLEEPATRWISGLREFEAIDKIAPAPAARQGKAKRSAAHDSANPHANHSSLRESKEVDARLPPGSAHFVFKQTQGAEADSLRAKDASPPLHFYFVPEGERTWIGEGEIETDVVSKLVDVLSGGAAAGVGGRADLASLRGETTGFGGFVTLALFEEAEASSRPGTPAEGRAKADRLAATKAFFAAIPFFAPQGAPKPPRVDVHAHLTAGVLTAMTALADKARAEGKPPTDAGE